MLSLRDLTYTEIATRIILSVLFGGILGMERGMKNRGAGLRTYMLVCLGSCVVMMTNQFLYQSYQSGDPARLGAQVINGIGFLGAGTIIVTKRNQIKGLTTAAGLWTSACAGLALGIGLYEVAGFPDAPEVPADRCLCRAAEEYVHPQFSGKRARTEF